MSLSPEGAAQRTSTFVDSILCCWNFRLSPPKTTKFLRLFVYVFTYDCTVLVVCCFMLFHVVRKRRSSSGSRSHQLLQPSATRRLVVSNGEGEGGRGREGEGEGERDGEREGGRRSLSSGTSPASAPPPPCSSAWPAPAWARGGGSWGRPRKCIGVVCLVCCIFDCQLYMYICWVNALKFLICGLTVFLAWARGGGSWGRPRGLVKR